MQRNAVLKAAQRCILYWEQHSTRCHSPQNSNAAVLLICVEWSCIVRSMSSNTVCHIPQNALHTNPVPVHERKGRTQFMLLCLYYVQSPNSWSRMRHRATAQYYEVQLWIHELRQPVFWQPCSATLGQCIEKIPPGLQPEFPTNHSLNNKSRKFSYT